MKMHNVIYLVIGFLCLCCTKIDEPREILFVCTHGAARSPIAAAYFNKIAKDHNLNYLAVFRGTESDASLSKGTAAGLVQDGFDIKNWKPQNVSTADIKSADKIVTFDCKLPFESNTKEVIQWNGTPSISRDYEKARDAIRSKVDQLVGTLSRE